MTNYSNADGYLVLGASVNSDPYNMSQSSKVSMQVVVNSDNDAEGTCKVQISNDAANWYDAFYWDADGTKQDGYDCLGGPFNVMWNLSENAPAKFTRVSWTKSSGGSGGLEYHICAKKV